MSRWQEQDGVYSARAGRLTLRVVHSKQFGSFGFLVIGGHIRRAGDKKTLAEAQAAAEAAAKALER